MVRRRPPARLFATTPARHTPRTGSGLSPWPQAAPHPGRTPDTAPAPTAPSTRPTHPRPPAPHPPGPQTSAAESASPARSTRPSPPRTPPASRTPPGPAPLVRGRGCLPPDHLHGDRTVQYGVVTAPHVAHAPVAELIQQFVTPRDRLLRHPCPCPRRVWSPACGGSAPVRLVGDQSRGCGDLPSSRGAPAGQPVRGGMGSGPGTHPPCRCTHQAPLTDLA